jgi:hypothetical protein
MERYLSKISRSNREVFNAGARNFKAVARKKRSQGKINRENILNAIKQHKSNQDVQIFAHTTPNLLPRTAI